MSFNPGNVLKCLKAVSHGAFQLLRLTVIRGYSGPKWSSGVHALKSRDFMPRFADTVTIQLSPPTPLLHVKSIEIFGEGSKIFLC
jgi:hypothetical protein